jgi:hypothetical protein
VGSQRQAVRRGEVGPKPSNVTWQCFDCNNNNCEKEKRKIVFIYCIRENLGVKKNKKPPTTHLGNYETNLEQV